MPSKDTAQPDRSLQKPTGTPAAVQSITLGELNHAPASQGSAVIDTAKAFTALPGTSNPLHQVKATLVVCVGQAEVTVGELVNAREHHVIQLDRNVDQSVDILLEGQVVARGILVAVGDHFGVRITELPAPLKP